MAISSPINTIVDIYLPRPVVNCLIYFHLFIVDLLSLNEWHLPENHVMSNSIYFISSSFRRLLFIWNLNIEDDGEGATSDAAITISFCSKYIARPSRIL